MTHLYFHRARRDAVASADPWVARLNLDSRRRRPLDLQLYPVDHQPFVNLVVLLDHVRQGVEDCPRQSVRIDRPRLSHVYPASVRHRVDRRQQRRIRLMVTRDLPLDRPPRYRLIAVIRVIQYPDPGVPVVVSMNYYAVSVLHFAPSAYDTPFSKPIFCRIAT